MITRAIAEVADGRSLTREEAREVMAGIMAGEATQAQIAGFLIALRAKGETADEIAGCAEAMREHVLPVPLSRTDVVDVVGTGGDAGGTLNISTAAAILAAAAGAAVAKHGNRAVSSASGSADVLEALGFVLEQEPERIAESIRKAIEACERLDGEEVDLSRVTASVGVATYPVHASDAETLFRQADAAMYVAKRSGKNRVAVSPPVSARTTGP